MTMGKYTQWWIKLLSIYIYIGRGVKELQSLPYALITAYVLQTEPHKNISLFKYALHITNALHKHKNSQKPTKDTQYTTTLLYHFTEGSFAV